MNKALRFVLRPKSYPRLLTAVSVCSGAGLSDLGYMNAGFRFIVQSEVNARRAQIGKDNFPDSEWIVGDIRQTWRDVVSSYKKHATRPLDLLVATPPCQGMSSSNPSRGKRKSAQAKKHEERNSLILAIIPLVEELKPRVVVAENVRQLLTLKAGNSDRGKTVIDVLRKHMQGYCFFTGVVDVADYGVPQGRKRAIIVAVREDAGCLAQLIGRQKLPWPQVTHGTNDTPHLTVGKWIGQARYGRLDAKSPDKAKGTHPLHFVPHYGGDRYLQVRCIPRNSGRSAYENDECPDCGYSPVPAGFVRCNRCAAVMRNRPYVFADRRPRLISGFKSSYRRMDPNKPAATITTNSSHVGSDFKIHPSENRVLSILECADLQTVPRSFNWATPLQDGRAYIIRNVIGEAFPPFFTFLHGRLLRRLLAVGSYSGIRAGKVLAMCQVQRATGKQKRPAR